MNLLKSTSLNTLLFVLVLFLTPFLFAVAQESAITTTSDGPSQTTTATPVNPYVTEQLDDDGRVVGDFVVGPGKIELNLTPGQSRTVELLVTNRMGETKDFIFEVEDIAGSTDPAQTVVLLGDDGGPYTLRDYIEIEAERFTLDHMERARVPVTVSIPADAEPGGRYGSVLISTVSRNAEVDTTTGATPSSAIVSRIGTLFFITTPGDVETAGELIDFATIGNQMFYPEGPIDFALLYENTGSIHLNPYGEISVTNIFGEEVGFEMIDPWFALPQSLRTREVTWNREFLIGRYTATVNINRGYDDIVDTLSVSFWVLPWKILLTAFAGLFIFFLILKFIFSKFELKRK